MMFLNQPISVSSTVRAAAAGASKSGPTLAMGHSATKIVWFFF